MSNNSRITTIDLTVATNFDHKLLENIADFDIVTSVYGKLASDPIGGGRKQ